MGPIQQIMQKCNEPMGRPFNRIDLKFWLIIIGLAATAISLIRAIPGMQATLVDHDRQLVEIQTTLKTMPDVIAAKIISQIKYNDRRNYNRAPHD